MLGFGGSDCEALHDSWLAQPVNTMSSVAYVIAAIVVLQRSRQQIVPGVALAAVGAGSFLYHGPMPEGAGVVHDGSLVALALAIAHAAWRRRLARPPDASVAVGAVALSLYALTRTDAPLCRPDSVLQGHGAWHVLTAAALAMWLALPPGARQRRR